MSSTYVPQSCAPSGVWYSWRLGMPKNIVICCDGTGNQYGAGNSNVVKLYQTLIRDPHRQIAYYHPGVGTMGAKNALTAAGKFWTKFRGLAFGYGLYENIADAYGFLMLTFEPGDQIYVFGFSRGAYTARALCGMLRMFWILSPGNEGLIPYAIRLFKSNDDSLLARITGRASKFRIAEGFKRTFGIECNPRFVGVWDTVSSVGWILDPIGYKSVRLPYTASLEGVSEVRHAVSIDERRAFFRQNLVDEDPGRVKQVWFAGVHSDVGGSYPEGESGLSKITLRWMLREAKEAGLLLDDGEVARIMGASPAFVKPLANAMTHNSLKGLWLLGEFWPKWTLRRISPPRVDPAKFRGSLRFNLFRRRFIAEDSCVHGSVLTRKAMIPSYNPSNLPQRYTPEDDPYTEQYRVHLELGQTAVVGVHSRPKWNDTTLQVCKGEKYLFAASGTWYDANIATGPAGYPSPSFPFRLVEWLRRDPKANWFALIGTIGQSLAAPFVIGEGCTLDVHTEGILYCFANDLPFTYFNNTGWVEVEVTRLA